jgi:hypothetical protein
VRATIRAPGAAFVASTFEDFEPDGHFDAVLSSNAFHWVDPEVGYAKVADVADAIVLIWNTPFVADPQLHRRVQEEVMTPHGSTFPADEAGVRELIVRESASITDEVRQSGRFEEPWTTLIERRLTYTPGRYADLIGSMGYVAASGEREAILAELAPVLGTEPIDLVDVVWAIAAQAA